MAKADKPVKNPITEEHAAKFKDYLDTWLHRLNLADWRTWLSPDRCTDAMASLASADVLGRIAVFKLGASFDPDPASDGELESAACHEAIHLRLRELVEEAMSEREYNDRVRGREEAVVVIFEKILMAYSQLLVRYAEDMRKDGPHPDPVLDTALNP
jgi:hypothetical protein